ncbi:hypothetical protein FDP41_012623 [Naegleria fowleri]|uniref:Coatomer subunit zeta n=1 Tax=Naegleria fowleri TaxID=5763 RepID=A0A6A5BTE5_NAEFO|nr:uncharacterized protein FDP41_012623 [Naegleria fowleri]KAF0981363.1 hypothetical protein FDP41_012623 [Naegleria fowleri]
MEAFIHQIRGVFVLDQNGKRLLSKYYSNDLKRYLLFVVGAGYENELVLSEVLSGLIDGLMMLFRNQLTKRTFLENFDLIVLALDEVLEDGIIIETDSSAIAQKVAAVETGADASSGVEGSETITQVFKSAREQLGELASSFFQF